jgi:hypothetical protein
MHVNYAEYSYFKKLSKSDKFQFFIELYEVNDMRDNRDIDLTQLFESINSSISESDSDATQHANSADFVDVMIDDENIMVESNSIRAIRQIVYRFFESGYILRRDKNMESMFKHDKVTRYLRVFRIVDQVSSICVN